MFEPLKTIWKPAALCAALAGCTELDNYSDDLPSMHMNFITANGSEHNQNLPISFSLPNDWNRLEYPLLKDGAGTLPPDKRQEVLKTINDLASTSEGLEYLQEAAAHSPGNRLHFVHNPNGQTFTLQGLVFLGNLDANATYLASNGERLPLTLDRVILHEITHNSFDHFSPEGSEAVASKYGLAIGSNLDTEISRFREVEAMAATNEYLSKYCGSVPRSSYEMKVQQGNAWFGREPRCAYTP